MGVTEKNVQAAKQSDSELRDLLRSAMRGFASTVTVVTARQSDQRYAMAATSFTALSMDPPSIVVCINRKTSIFPALEATDYFAVNILSQRHLALAQACGRSDDRAARFEIGAFIDDEFGVPRLADAQASIGCRIEERLRYGSHTMVVGRVTAIDCASDIDPLVYLNGGYCSTEAAIN